MGYTPLCGVSKAQINFMIVVLDNIRSVHNVGSIFRTSDAVGVEKIYLVGITPTPLDRFKMVNERLRKVALGSELIVPWSQEKDVVALAKGLKKSGYEIVALEQSKKSIPIFSGEIKIFKDKKIALFLGAEVSGLSKQILQLSDYIIDIPMNGKKESLNVAVAFGVAAYQLTYAS